GRISEPWPWRDYSKRIVMRCKDSDRVVGKVRARRPAANSVWLLPSGPDQGSDSYARRALAGYIGFSGIYCESQIRYGVRAAWPRPSPFPTWPGWRAARPGGDIGFWARKSEARRRWPWPVEPGARPAG